MEKGKEDMMAKEARRGEKKCENVRKKEDLPSSPPTTILRGFCSVIVGFCGVARDGVYFWMLKLRSLKVLVCRNC